MSNKREAFAYVVRAGKLGQATAILSTDQLARDGMVIEKDAWNLAPFKQNNILAWSHDYSRPALGRVNNLRSDERGLIGDLEFDMDSGDQFAEMCAKKVATGVLGAVSVGFSVDRQEGNRVKAATLLEVSLVNVPADTGALMIARSAYAKAKPQTARQFLDPATWKRLTPDEQERVLREIRKRLDLIGIRNELVKQSIPGLVKKQLAERIPAK